MREVCSHMWFYINQILIKQGDHFLKMLNKRDAMEIKKEKAEIAIGTQYFLSLSIKSDRIVAISGKFIVSASKLSVLLILNKLTLELSLYLKPYLESKLISRPTIISGSTLSSLEILWKSILI